MIAFKKKALLSLAIAGLVSTQAQAAVTGSMDLSVTMPEILVLYHFDKVTLDLTAAAAEQVVSEGDKVVTGTATITPVTGALSIQGATTVGTTSNVAVTLNNAWAVRSISANTVKVAGSIESTELTGANGSVIGVTGMNLTSGTESGADVDLSSQWAVQTGNIEFELDLSNATEAGVYDNNGTSDTFLLTLSGN